MSGRHRDEAPGAPPPYERVVAAAPAGGRRSRSVKDPASPAAAAEEGGGPLNIVGGESEMWGTNLQSLNLFGMMFWGMLLTGVMECAYCMISIMLAATNYKFKTYEVFFWFWGGLLFVSMVFYLALLFNGMLHFKPAYAVFLLMLAMFPASYAGWLWEENYNENVVVDPLTPDANVERMGWLYLVAAPLLWPPLAFIIVSIAALVSKAKSFLFGAIKVRSSFMTVL